MSLSHHSRCDQPETADCTIIIPVPRRSVDHQGTTMTLCLHTAHLSAKSAFFRSLFIGSPQDRSTSRSRVPQSRLPRLLTSPPSHPVVFLPVPDPYSIQPLFHWLHSGSTDHIENALDRGDVQWEGLARNVEYLGLSTDIKVFLGRWYRNWFRSPDCMPCTMDEDDESDCDDSDSNTYYTEDETQRDDECDRGRTRDVRSLVQLCGRLRLCTTS